MKRRVSVIAGAMAMVLACTSCARKNETAAKVSDAEEKYDISYYGIWNELYIQ